MGSKLSEDRVYGLCPQEISIKMEENDGWAEGRVKRCEKC